jgi:CBS domain containing-hemolysin-like protein
LIEADEAAMIFKVFQLNDLKAKDLMIPRVSAPCLNGSSNLDEISKTILSENSPWWVILGDKVDKIQGVVKRENILEKLIIGNKKQLLSEICEPVEYIPEMIKVDQLLTRFDKNHKGVKVVVDEFGGFVGIIGAEAVLSVLAGWWRKK